MLISKKIRLEISPQDAATLEFMQGKCRGLYNWWVMKLRDGEKWPGWKEAKKTLQESRDYDPELRFVYGKCLQEAYFRLDGAMQAFFRRVQNGEKPGFPRVRPRHNFFTLIYPAMYIKVEGLHITLPTGGKGRNKRFPDVVARLTEEAPIGYRDVATSRDGQGHYYASFVHDEKEETHEHDGVLAIDLGVKTLATGVSDKGRFYHIGGFKGSRWYNKQLDKIRSKRDRSKKDLFLKAYGKIYRNNGARTHGVTDETPDGMSLEKGDAISEALRYERYQWLPARRTSIPKKNGTKRPLGMPVWSEKLVQEVIRLILEAYYEPQFSNHSHGFRPERGCHTARREIYHNWTGTVWLIEGDISPCFDKLDHTLLLRTLSEQVHDGRLLNLIREVFQAGDRQDWTVNETLSGVPQGGIISPLLSTILLSTLDKYGEPVLIPEQTKGNVRKANKAYTKLMRRSERRRKSGKAEEAKVLRKQAQSIPSLNVNDPDYRRLKYVRDADDFLLGFIGPEQEAEEIKQPIATFLREELNLELSQVKTLITHARSESARFLGYEITVRPVDTKRCVTKNGTDRRNINGKIGVRVPKNVLEDKAKNYKQGGKAIHRIELEHESDFAIISKDQLEFRGLANSYQVAYNMRTLSHLKWVMENSLVKTLTQKFKVSVPKIYEK